MNDRERLRAAFEESADERRPDPGLRGRTLASLRRQVGEPEPRPWLRAGFALAALALVLVVAGSALVFSGQLSPGSSAGQAPGKGRPDGPGVAVPTPIPSPPADLSFTAGEMTAVADNVFPLVQPYGYYGVCGLNGDASSCPYTARLKARLAELKATLCRCQNPSPTRAITADPAGHTVDVVMYSGGADYRLILVRSPDGRLLVDDEQCGARPETSIYLGLTACGG